MLGGMFKRGIKMTAMASPLGAGMMMSGKGLSKRKAVRKVPRYMGRVPMNGQGMR